VLCRITVTLVNDSARFGRVLTSDTRVTEFLEKGAHGPGQINAGFYRIDRKAFMDFNDMPGAVFSFESDVMPRLPEEKSLSAVSKSGTFVDIGIPEDYRKFCAIYGAGTIQAN
jgi:D-glycero-alpha-D-manno-heptose 1-phosphate guanylyltransferase